MTSCDSFGRRIEELDPTDRLDESRDTGALGDQVRSGASYSDGSASRGHFGEVRDRPVACVAAHTRMLPSLAPALENRRAQFVEILARGVRRVLTQKGSSVSNAPTRPSGTFSRKHP